MASSTIARSGGRNRPSPAADSSTVCYDELPANVVHQGMYGRHPRLYSRTLLARVAKWQTQQTQNLPGRSPRVGSSPTSGTKTIGDLMRRLSVVVAVVSLAFASVVLADENPRNQPGQREERLVRFVLPPAPPLPPHPQHPLPAL